VVAHGSLRSHGTEPAGREVLNRSATEHILSRAPGPARHFDLAVGERVAREAAWSYPSPSARYAVLCECIAVYPGRVDACYVDGERVQPQQGGYYGGWIPHDVVGPFKGGPGTQGW